MKKYFCDICGKELQEQEVNDIAPIGIKFSSYYKIYQDVNKMNLRTDVCAECLPRFYEVFKESLEKVKEKATN